MLYPKPDENPDVEPSVPDPETRVLGWCASCEEERIVAEPMDPCPICNCLTEPI